jgi:hypothetical protein
MKQLLIVTTLIEIGAGLCLGFRPEAAVALLLGAPLEGLAAVTLGRVGGAALCALGVACWLAHYDAHSIAARGLVGAMLLYNFCTVVILATAGTCSQAVGTALWPAVIIHAAMTVWCITCLLRKAAPAAK